MTQPDTLHTRLRAEIDRRLAVARAASGRDHGSTPTGEHWHWECGQCDTHIDITPVTILDEHLECPSCEYGQMSLRSDEEYPSSIGPLPHFVISGTEELTPADALHIALHDPADAIRRYEGELEVLERHAPKRYFVAPPTFLCLHCSSLCHSRSGLGCDSPDAPYPCDEIRSLAGRLRMDV